MHRGRATLQELRTIYDLEDAYTIWEADYVPESNAATIERRAIEKQKLHRGIFN